MNNQKGFVSILLSIIITAILVGGAIYFWQQQVTTKLINDKTSQLEQQSQDQVKILQEKISDLEKAVALAESEDTDNWQTYTNSDFSYAISYLEGWLIKENEYPGCEITACDRIKGSDITITIRRSENSLSLKTYIDNKKVAWHANNYYDTKVDKLEAIKEVYDFNQYSLSIDDLTSYWSPVNYFIKKDNYIYSIELEIKQQADEQKYRELFDELVGTFKFLDDNTADWQTYTNSDLGYTINYPEEYILDSEHSTSAGVWWKVNNVKGFSILYHLEKLDGSLVTWFDNNPVGDITLGGISGKKFSYRYCDGPGCGPESVAYVIQYKGKLLGLVLSGDYEIDTNEQKIIDSFKFLD